MWATAGGEGRCHARLPATHPFSDVVVVFFFGVGVAAEAVQSVNL